jgi:foldase protein PrsA
MRRPYVLAGTLLVAVVITTGCGSTGTNAVVQVSSTPITKEAFNHWMVVAVSSATTSTTAAKVPVPVPPAYATCIAHLRATEAAPAKGKTAATTAKRKSECAQEYQSLKQKVLGFLISTDWVIGEASSLGVTVSDKEVEQEFAKIKKKQFPKEAEFQKFLASSGQTIPDLLLRVKVNTLSARIQKNQVAGLAAGRARAVLREFLSAFQTKWKAKTNCTLGYIVADCRQYTGATPPTTTLG